MAEESRKVHVLFVCLGNICRSTMAEAVFRDIVHKPDAPHPLIDDVDSAGTGAWHIGCSPDPRTTATLDANGVDGYQHSARQVSESDFEEFDYVLGMDQENVRNLKFMKNRIIHRRGGGDATGLAHVGLFGDYGGKGGKAEEVVDPYYGGESGFTVAYEQMVRFTAAFLQMLEEKQGSGKL